jgi:DNA repair exonuclease SbcCD nuclease subunit
VDEMKFLRTADLQIGARFTQFGEQAERLRAARVAALERILDLAARRSLDAVLIAGDLFESNQLSDRSVAGGCLSSAGGAYGRPRVHCSGQS